MAERTGSGALPLRAFSTPGEDEWSAELVRAQSRCKVVDVRIRARMTDLLTSADGRGLSVR